MQKGSKQEDSSLDTGDCAQVSKRGVVPGVPRLSLLALDILRMDRSEVACIVTKYSESASDDIPHPALPGMVMASMS